MTLILVGSVAPFEAVQESSEQVANAVKTPKAFGAVGDCVVATGAGTDDTAALQAWLDSGTNLTIDAACYKFTDTLIVTKGTQIVGGGAKSSILYGALSDANKHGLQLGSLTTAVGGASITLRDFAILGGAAPGNAAIVFQQLALPHIDIYINGGWQYAMRGWENADNDGEVWEYAGIENGRISISQRHADQNYPTVPDLHRGLYVWGWVNATRLRLDIGTTQTEHACYLKGSGAGRGMTCQIVGVVQGAAGKAIVIDGDAFGTTIKDIHCEGNVGTPDIDITGCSGLVVSDVYGNVKLSNCPSARLGSIVGTLELDSGCESAVCTGPVASDSEPVVHGGAPGLVSLAFNAYSTAGGVFCASGHTPGDADNMIVNGDFLRWIGAAVWGCYGPTLYAATKCGVGQADTTRTLGSPLCAKLVATQDGAVLSWVVAAADALEGYLNQTIVLSFKWKKAAAGDCTGSFIRADQIGTSYTGGNVETYSFPCEDGFKRFVGTWKITQALIDAGIAAQISFQPTAQLYVSEVGVNLGVAAPRSFARRTMSVDGTVRINNGRLEAFASAAPASGGDPIAGSAWQVGDIVWSTEPAAGEPIGWSCTVAGSPGTWVAFGTLPA